MGQPVICLHVHLFYQCALFSPKKLQNFSYSLSYRIFRCMHEVLNIDKNKKLITQFTCNLRDESFKPS